MMTPQNFGYNSWTELYDFLKTQDSICRNTQSVIMRSNIIAKTVKTYKIRMNTVKQHCWDEIQDLRISKKDTWNISNAVNRWCMDYENKNRDLESKANGLLIALQETYSED
jgi:hypothetical protein